MFLSFLLCIQRQQTGKGKQQNWRSGRQNVFLERPHPKPWKLPHGCFVFRADSKQARKKATFVFFLSVREGSNRSFFLDLFYERFLCACVGILSFFFHRVWGTKLVYIFGLKFVESPHDWAIWSQFVIVRGFRWLHWSIFNPLLWWKASCGTRLAFFCRGVGGGTQKKQTFSLLQSSRLRKQMCLKEKIKAAQLVQKLSQFKRTLRAYFPLGFSPPTISNAFFADDGWEPACIFWPDFNDCSCASSACENHGVCITSLQKWDGNYTKVGLHESCLGWKHNQKCVQKVPVEKSTDVFVLVAIVEEVAVGNHMVCTLETLCLCTQTRTRRRLFLFPP